MSFTLAAVSKLVMLAVLCEAVTEQVKELLPEDAPSNYKRFVSLAVGLALAGLLRISLFANATGMAHIAGILLAGLVCSRGSNYVHDLFGMFSKVSDAVGQTISR